MSNSKVREEFEAACRKHAEDAGFDEYDYGFERSSEDSGCYADSHTQAAWWAWQASREALVIALPREVSLRSPTEVRDMIKHHIESLGLKVSQ